MLQFLLSFFLLTVPSSLDPPLEASEPVADAANYLPVSVAQTSPERGPLGSIWLSFGHGQASNYFDHDGNRSELGRMSLPPELGGGEVSTNAQFQVFALHFGGAVNVLQLENATISVGAELGLAQRTLTTDEVEIPELPEPIVPASDVSSGLAPQNLRVFISGGTDALSLRTGFLLDIGQDDDDQLPNSDGQNAILFGVSGQHQLPAVRVFGSLDYFLMLEGSGHDISPAYDHGDLLSAEAGLGYAIGSVELGASLIYRRTGEGYINGMDGGDIPPQAFEGGPNPHDVTEVLSVAPYISYAPANEQYSVYLKGAEQREYVDYGWTITGRNDLSPRIGFTLGATYGF